MSYERSGLPGICTAVRHFVCVFAGAPVPVHTASAAPEAATPRVPSTADATMAGRRRRRWDIEDMVFCFFGVVGGNTRGGSTALVLSAMFGACAFQTAYGGQAKAILTVSRPPDPDRVLGFT